MSSTRRWIMWLALLGAAAALVLYDRKPAVNGAVVADTPRPTPVSGAGSPAPRERAGSPAADAPILAIQPRRRTRVYADSFSPHDWTPPPPPVKRVVPPPPAAPAVPYTVLGKKYEDGQWQVFLARQGHVFVVTAHDLLENTYRIEETRPPTMTLTYLPLQQLQSLPIGGVE